MMKNQITSDWIDRYNENELGVNEKALFESRMLTNPLLRAEVELDDCLNHFLADEGMIDLMNKVRKVSRENTHGSPRLNYLLLAASLLCLAMIGGLFYMIQYNKALTDRSPMQPVQQFIKTQKTEQPVFLPQYHDDGYTGSIPAVKNPDHVLLANKNEPLAEYELLIGSVMRADLFNLISPEADVAVLAGDDVLFSWKADCFSAQVNIIILDNRGACLAEIPVLNDTSYLMNTKRFREGLYYWKIMVEDDLVFLGKLTILPERKN
jgi:hypothetical protein